MHTNNPLTDHETVLNCPSETLYQSPSVSFIPEISHAHDEKRECHLTVLITSSGADPIDVLSNGYGGEKGMVIGSAHWRTAGFAQQV